MGRYILKRLLVFFPMLVGVSLMTFLFIHMAPGSFVDTLKLNPQISPQVIKSYEDKFSLNQPLYCQYGAWLQNIMKGDLGYSFAYRVPVTAVIASRLLNTLLLSLTAMILAWVLAIPLGILAVLNRGRFIDRAISLVSSLGIALPSFFLAFLLLAGAMCWGGLPLGGMHSVNYDELNVVGKAVDILRHLIIPALVLAIPAACALQKIMRANLLEVMGSPYILAARARGLGPVRIFCIHALKNALNPMITIFGYQFGDLLSGAAITEVIVGWPGLGVVTLEAVRSQDVYLVMGAVLMGALMLLTGNLAADILLAGCDPRVKYR